MPTALVTGGAGFIGTNLARVLLQRGYDVLLVDCLDETLYGRDLKLRNLGSLFGESVEPIVCSRAGFYESDHLTWIGASVINHDTLWRIARDMDVEVIFHLAALAGVRPSLEDPLKYSRYNVEGTVSVLETAKTIGCSVVFASSSSIYGELPTPFSEDAVPTAMISPYAVSKLQGELLMDYYAREWGVPGASLRFFTVYGPHGRPDMFIRKTIEKVERGETITLYGDGGSFRDYTYVDDIVNGVIAAGHTVIGGHHVYNLGCGKPNSLLETVRLIGEAVGREPVVQHIEDQKGDVPGTLADISKAREELDYEPLVDLAEGIKLTVEWMRSQP